LFADNPFFDSRDLIQVRYEMVRRHQADGIPISDVAASFGVSRPTFYKTQDTLAAAGLAGLLPQPRGPKGGHKISAEVVAFVVDLKAASPALTTQQCLASVEARFGIKVHRRSLERALARKKTIRPAVSAVSANAVDSYELLRAAVLRADPDAGPNLAVLRREGLTAWSRRLIETRDIDAPLPDPARYLPALPAAAAAANELTRLIAGIVLAITAEPAHV
jgi:transposase